MKIHQLVYKVNLAAHAMKLMQQQRHQDLRHLPFQRNAVGSQISTPEDPMPNMNSQETRAFLTFYLLVADKIKVRQCP